VRASFERHGPIFIAGRAQRVDVKVVREFFPGLRRDSVENAGRRSTRYPVSVTSAFLPTPFYDARGIPRFSIDFIARFASSKRMRKRSQSPQ
jgi:hypothetical protein